MWRLGTVVALQDETATARTIRFEVPDWPGHVAGQHMDVRLTASDGYSAVRSYSIASAPNANEHFEITVERLPDGEVSPYLTQEVMVGDRLELRSDPRDVSRIIALSKASYRKMIQNLAWATGYNVIAIPLAAGTLARWGIILSPAIGAALMSASTVIVAVNAQLLRRVRLTRT